MEQSLLEAEEPSLERRRLLLAVVEVECQRRLQMQLQLCQQHLNSEGSLQEACPNSRVQLVV